MVGSFVRMILYFFSCCRHSNVKEKCRKHSVPFPCSTCLNRNAYFSFGCHAFQFESLIILLAAPSHITNFRKLSLLLGLGKKQNKWNLCLTLMDLIFFFRFICGWVATCNCFLWKIVWGNVSEFLKFSPEKLKKLNYSWILGTASHMHEIQVNWINNHYHIYMVFQ